MTAPADPAAAFQRLVEALHGLSIPFLVGGSLASSIHGIYRATADIDLVADVHPEHVGPLVKELGGEFYADGEMIRESLGRGRAFNLIHYSSSYKFDVFPLSPAPYYQTQFAGAAWKSSPAWARLSRFPWLRRRIPF